MKLIINFFPLFQVNIYFWWIKPEFIILAAIPSALTGGFAVLIMACFAYVSDLSNRNSRTTRIAFVDMMLGAGAPLGMTIFYILFTTTLSN